MSTPEDEIRAVLDESGPDYNGFTFETPGGGHQSDVYMVTLDHGGEEYEVVVKFQPGGEDAVTDGVVGVLDHGGEEYEVVVKFKPDGDVPFDVEPKLH